MAETYSKTDVLQVLLDTQVLAGDLFDAVEADTFVVTRELIERLGNLVSRLAPLHRLMVIEYAFSSRITADFFSDMRKGLNG